MKAGSLGGEAPLTVSAFLSKINELLETQVVWVEGEVVEVRVSQRRWLHFDLKDASGLVHCFGLVFRLRTPLEDGMRVRVWAVPRVYPRFGKFSLVVDSLEPSGEGALRRAFELLKATLAADGLFDAARKRPLPKFPERIALLTSPEAAAYHDVLNILAVRRGGMDILFLPIPVQGEGAAAVIAHAIDWVNENEATREVLVLVRGGGSVEDLHAWNDERVARALARSRIPTLVGIGHERDVTLADLVADVRASTPSHAAQLLTPTAGDMRNEVEDLKNRLLLVFHVSVDAQAGRIVQHVSTFREKVRGDRDRVGVVLHGLERLLAGYHPSQVLARGYSVTTDDAGVVLRDARKVTVGDALVTRLARGTLRSHTTVIHGAADREFLPSVRGTGAHRRRVRNRRR